MTKKRTRQSTRRQAKKLEIACIRPEVLKALGRDLDQFLEEQRQRATPNLIEPNLIDQAAALNGASNPPPPRD